MIAFLVTTYVLSAIAFYVVSAKNAPIMEDLIIAPVLKLELVEGGVAVEPLRKVA